MIMIRDLTIGGAYHGFDPVDEGYQEAYEFIREIQEQGHKVGGDVKQVLDYMRSSPHLRPHAGFGGWLL